MTPQNASQNKKSEQQHSSKNSDFLNEQTAVPFIQAKKGTQTSFFGTRQNASFFGSAPVMQHKSTKVSSFTFPNVPIIQHKCEHCEEETTQKKENDEATPKSLQMKTASSNSDLSPKVQMKMENAFGQDFSNVNIHKDSKSATDVGALAYAQGNDVHFAPGQFKPNTQAGQELIGHELTHVIQQREGRVKPTTQAKGLPVNDDKGLEKEAKNQYKIRKKYQ